MNETNVSDRQHDDLIEATLARARSKNIEPTSFELLAAVRQAAPEINLREIYYAIDDYCLRREPGLAELRQKESFKGRLAICLFSVFIFLLILTIIFGSLAEILALIIIVNVITLMTRMLQPKFRRF